MSLFVLDTDIAVAYDHLAHAVMELSELSVLAFPLPAITRFEHLKKLKLKVSGSDLRIAAIVLEHDATLVTRNEKDFRRVPGLKIENWAK